MQRRKTVSGWLRALCTSNRFFYVTVGLLVGQALWIALSSHYPMAFDEDFHLGIIKLYAHHISPFWSAHPAGADAFGAVGCGRVGQSGRRRPPVGVARVAGNGWRFGKQT